MRFLEKAGTVIERREESRREGDPTKSCFDTSRLAAVAAVRAGELRIAG